MKRSIIFLNFFIVVLLCCGDVQARVVGSNSASARQVATFFPAVDTDNTMLGFSVFEKGIMLESGATTCLCDMFFPLSGNIVLNGGTLTLARDLELKSPFYAGPGTINGQGFCSLSYPANVSVLSFPSSEHDRLLNLFYETNIGGAVYSVDWSFDDKYVAVARQGITGQELQIYLVEDMVVTLTASLDFGNSSVYSVRWHPENYYFAIGKTGGDTLETYYLNVADGSLQKIDGYATSTVYAVAWGPVGDRLAVGRTSNSNMLVFDMSGGTLGTSYEASFGRSSTVRWNALGWDSAGSYVAAGLSSSNQNTELKIFHFTGSAVELTTELEFGTTVYAVDWHPSEPYLAVGLNSGSDSLKLYEFDSGTGTLSYVASQAGLTDRIYGVRWSYNGAYLTAVTQSSSLAFDVNLLSFNAATTALNVAAGYRSGSTFYSAGWSHDTARLCVGDSAGEVILFNCSSSPLVFKDINLFLNSSVEIIAPVIFEGACLVNGGGKTFTFGTNGTLVVADGGSLVLEDVSLRGITADCIACASDSSLLTLRNVSWQQDSLYTFSVGSLQLKKAILMSGDAIFAYSSSQTSTLLAQSELTLDIGFTFSYDPGVPSKTLFVLEDATSKLIFNGNTLHTTVTGMQLTKGNIKVVRESFLFSETQVVFDEALGGDILINEGITLGSSVLADDIYIDVASGATLRLSGGSLCYKNIAPDALDLHTASSVIYIDSQAVLKVYESMILGNGVLSFGDGAILAYAPEKTVTGSLQPCGRLITTELV